MITKIKTNHTLQKCLISLIAITCIILSFCIAAEYFSDSDSAFNNIFQEQLNKKILSATVIFSIAKSISGVISVLQTVEIEASVVFANMSLSPLNVLASINQTINTLSDLFLFSMMALVFQKFFLLISAWFAFKVIFPVAGLITLLSIWIQKLQPLRNFAVFLTAAGIMAFTLIPLSVQLSIAVDNYFLNDTIEQAHIEMLNEQASLTSMQEEFITEKSTWNKIKESVSIESMKKILDRTLQYCRNLVKSLVNAFVAMMITTLIIPILTMISLWMLLKYAVNSLNLKLSAGTLVSRGLKLTSKIPVQEQALELHKKLEKDRITDDKLLEKKNNDINGAE